MFRSCLQSLSSPEAVATVVKDGRAPAWVVLPWMLGLGRQCQCCCAHTQYPRRLLVPGDVSAAQKKMSRRSKAVVVREFADQITGSKKAPLQARRPYQNPPSLIRERRLQCTNTPNRQHLNNHASGPFQIEDGACKHWYLIHLLVRLSIHDLRSPAHNCGRN
jgi:hypothetical protein